MGFGIEFLNLARRMDDPVSRKERNHPRKMGNYLWWHNYLRNLLLLSLFYGYICIGVLCKDHKTTMCHTVDLAFY